MLARHTYATFGALAALTALTAPAESLAFDLGAAYTLDLAAAREDASALYNLDIVADADLARLIGWRGAALHMHLLSNGGDEPRLADSSLQGVDNIEAGRHAARVLEFWLEQSWENGASARAGLYDLNTEFYYTPSAELFLNPAFGAGPELDATISDDPSAIPLTGLALRLRHEVSTYFALQAAIIQADPHDHDGYRKGALLLAEAQQRIGVADISLGAWRYTRRQPHIRNATDLGAPTPHVTHGAYAMLAAPLWGDEDAPRHVTGFVRAGVSDGDTHEIANAWQAGLVLAHAFDSRPHATLGLGVAQARVGNYNETPGAKETTFEITYGDRVTDWLYIQPSLQWVMDPEGDRSRNDEAIGIVRFVIER